MTDLFYNYMYVTMINQYILTAWSSGLHGQSAVHLSPQILLDHVYVQHMEYLTQLSSQVHHSTGLATLYWLDKQQESTTTMVLNCF